jgi:hypothetical protein
LFPALVPNETEQAKNQKATTNETTPSRRRHRWDAARRPRWPRPRWRTPRTASCSWCGGVYKLNPVETHKLGKRPVSSTGFYIFEGLFGKNIQHLLLPKVQLATPTPRGRMTAPSCWRTPPRRGTAGWARAACTSCTSAATTVGERGWWHFSHCYFGAKPKTPSSGRVTALTPPGSDSQTTCS